MQSTIQVLSQNSGTLQTSVIQFHLASTSSIVFSIFLKACSKLIGSVIEAMALSQPFSNRPVFKMRIASIRLSGTSVSLNSKQFLMAL